MTPTQSPQRFRLLRFFLAGCAISALSSLAFYLWFGRASGAVFLRPGPLFSSILGDGVGALLLLGMLLPLRSVGAGPFWACGIGVVVVLWPPLSDLVSAAVDQAAGGLQPPQARWGLPDWFYSLLHQPDNLVLVGGSAALLGVVARLWPPPQAAGAEPVRSYRRVVPAPPERMGGRALLFSFAGRINRRPYLVATLALGLPNAVAQPLVPAGLGMALQIALYWPLLALASKRAHDRGHGGGWIACMVGVPGALAILLRLAVLGAGRLDASTVALVLLLDLLIALPAVWALAEFFLLRGVRGANRHGADPLASLTAAPVVGPPPLPRTQAITPFAGLPARITEEAAARFRRRFKKK